MVKKQLEAAARNYYLALNQAYATMDEVPLAALRTTTCTCQKIEKAIRDARIGGYTVHLQYSIVSAEAHDFHGNVGGVTLSYNASATTVTDGSGNVVDRSGPTHLGIKEILLESQGGHFLISNVITYK